MGNLSAKQERFCQEYVIDCNGTQAVIRTGYSKNGADVQAFRLLRNAKIKERVGELQEEVAKTVGLTAKYVLDGLVEVYERCMQKVAITDDYGAAAGFTFNASGAIRSLELMGKHLNLFDGKLGGGGDKQTIEIVLSAMGGNGEPKKNDRLTGVWNGNSSN